MMTKLSLEKMIFSDSLFNPEYDAYKFLDNAKIYSKNYGDSILYSINTINNNTTSIPLLHCWYRNIKFYRNVIMGTEL